MVSFAKMENTRKEESLVKGVPISFKTSVIFGVYVRNPKEHTSSVVEMDCRLKF